MQKTLMMVSGLLATMRFAFVYTVLVAAGAAGCAFVPWGSVLGFMKAGPVACGFFACLACIALWMWALASVVVATLGFIVTIIGTAKLSEYPLWWTALTTDSVTEKRHLEVWRVLVWLLFVPAELANLVLLPICGLVRLIWRLLSTVMAFDLAKLGKR